MAMYEGNWTCSQCGGTITQLPFQPKSEKGLTCRTCFAKGKETEKAEAPVPEMTTASEPMPEDGVPDFDEAQLAGEPPADDGLGGTPTNATSGAGGGGEKPSFSGDWTCSQCGGSITSLPFQPKSANNLKCIDCFKANRA